MSEIIIQHRRKPIPCADRCDAEIEPRLSRKAAGTAKNRGTQVVILIHEIGLMDPTFMKDAKIPLGTILPIELQVAKWLRLVKRVRIVPLQMPRRYGLLIEGRGFSRMLDSETPHPGGIHRPAPFSISQPRAFFPEGHARSCASSFGLDRLIT